MNPYLVSTHFGGAIVQSETPLGAYIKYITEEIPLGDMFIEREDLIKRGYSKVEHTAYDKVYLLIK